MKHFNEVTRLRIEALKIFLKKNILLLSVLLIMGVFVTFQTLYPPAQLSTTRTLIHSTDENIRFAVIGDFGLGKQAELDVAELVKSWDPDFIVTTGDNNYAKLGMFANDRDVGKYYHEYIGYYHGVYGTSDGDRFFPALGNHDWDSIICFSDSCRGAYFKFFSLPNNERYYDFIWGPIHFLILDSDPREPDGTSPDSVQGVWFENKLAESTSPWQVVVAHHAPYTSGERGSAEYMRWPYKEWGADMILSGHSHNYERSLVDDLLYIVNGLGGKSLHDFETPIPESLVRYNDDYGAMLVEADASSLSFKFISRTGEEIDQFTLQH